ncbi:MAG: complex I NDUFA9 subunit family protein [Alphaproteobacteria bacterium]|nr:complex I NDUFA9 subunit family protein [Alphaproteobacteria bacterium]
MSKIICIFGGTGFLGKYVTQELARAGYRIKIATRYPESAYELKTYGDVGQIVPVACDYREGGDVDDLVKGCDAVINLIGILYEKGKNNFARIHIDVPERIAKACAKHEVKSFVHVSALGIDKAHSKYAKSKLAGEEAVSKAFPKTTILRPSVIFGPGDGFFNLFAKLSCFLPVLPLIGGGETKFQTVYADDIAHAIAKIVRAGAQGKQDYQDKIYELGGPEIVSFKEIYGRLFEQTNRPRALISIPWGVAKFQGAILSLMPKPLLTRDQVTSLQSDNVVSDKALTFDDLGIAPSAMESVLPEYLSCYKRGGPFSGEKITSF